MRNADKLLSLPKLAKDDCFTFGCNQCGACCRNRDDILLTPLDLYKIAKHFGKSTDEILVEYCTVHEGEVSKLPCILIKSLEYRKTCPFLGKTGCEIHSAKPAVCALFPLGRMTNTETKELAYFVQPINCGNKRQSQTVQEWLGEFSMIEEEAFNILWHEKIIELVAIIKEIYAQNIFRDMLPNVLLSKIYLDYNPSLDFDGFMRQFNANIAEMLWLLNGLKDEISRNVAFHPMFHGIGV
ncbi:MAG: YkgJ family cysteine cluster protein [Oscillospiraceae bacterium]|nr:YkgJ family cysteine cluster protein [Oscillospiraceae bacterium]